MTIAALVLLGVLSAAALPFWRDQPAVRHFRLRAGAVLLTSVVVLGVVAWLAVRSGDHGPTERQFAATLAVLASLTAGGPVAKASLRLADPGTPTAPQGPARTSLLTGGSWIGALERIAVTVTLLAHWPEGLALVLVVKGLGRYPELRSAGQADQSGVAERFIIGTFASALWAASCAGIGLLLMR